MEHLSKQQIEESKYVRAKKRIDEIRKFYKHLMVFLIVNIFISFFKVREYMLDGNTFMEALTNFDTYIVWLVWGFFLLLNAVRTFSAHSIFGPNWEERKIKEFMNEN